MKSLQNFTKKLTDLLNVICGILLIICSLNAFINVISRYVFSKPFSWGEEVSVLTLVWMVFLSQGILERNNDQLRLTIIYRLIGIKVQSILNIIRSVVTVFLSSYLFYAGINTVIRNFHFKINTQAMNFPYWIVYLVLPIFFAIITIIRIFDPKVVLTENEVDASKLPNNKINEEKSEKGGIK